MDRLRYGLPTDTKHVHMESRQYSFGIDLGPGVPRIYMLVGFVLAVVWIPFVAIVFHLHWLAFISVYAAPPVIGTFVALHKDRSGRYAYAAVLDRWRWLKRRHRSLIPSPGRTTPKRRHQRFLHNLLPVNPNPTRVLQPQFRVIDTTTVRGSK